jgi:hypothetical protein
MVNSVLNAQSNVHANTIESITDAHKRTIDSLTVSHAKTIESIQVTHVKTINAIVEVSQEVALEYASQFIDGGHTFVTDHHHVLYGDHPDLGVIFISMNPLGQALILPMMSQLRPKDS